MEFEEGDGIIHRHSQNIIDVLALILNLENFFLKSFAFAGVAFQVHICHKLHFYGNLSFSFAFLTASAIYIKRKMLRLIAPYFAEFL